MRRTKPKFNSRNLRAIAASVSGIALVGYLVLWGAGFGTDLLVYREGAAQWLAGHDPSRVSYTPYGLNFTYPPFALIVFSTVAWPSFVVTKWMLWGADVATLTSIIFIVRRRTGDEPEHGWLSSLTWALVALLVLEPARRGMSFVQIEFFLMFLVVVDLFVLPAGAGGGSGSVLLPPSS